MSGAALRVLMAAAGTGGIPAPVPEIVELLASGGVVGITKVSPAAVHHNGVVYFGYVSNGGSVSVASYDLASETVSTPVVVDTGAEAHAAPSIAIRPSDGRILVYWALHDAATPYVAVSTNPEDATAFDAKQSLHSQLGASADYTYMSVVRLDAEDTFYLFWRDYTGSTGRLAYSTSSDGETWATRTLLVKATSGSGNVVYWRVSSDWESRIDIITTDADRSDARPASLYHLYWDGAWRKSDGTAIVATQPFFASEATLIKNSSGGSIDPGDVHTDGSTPACVFQAYQSGTTSNDVWAARWNGSSWDTTNVVNTGGIVGGNRFVGGSAMTSANSLFFPKKVASDFEMHRATSDDGGATWDVAALTSDAVDTMLVTAVRGGVAGGPRVIWSFGTWTSDSSYSLGIAGWG